MALSTQDIKHFTATLDLLKAFAKQESRTAHETPEERSRAKARARRDTDFYDARYFSKWNKTGDGRTTKMPPKLRECYDYMLADMHAQAVADMSRGLGKSATLSLKLPIHLAIKGEPMVCVIYSNTIGSGVKLGNRIRKFFENNQDFKRDWGEPRSPNLPWTEEHFETRQGWAFFVFSAQTSPRGISMDEVRPTLIIIDDLETDATVASAEQTQKRYNAVWGQLYASRNTDPTYPARVMWVGNSLSPGSACAMTKQRAKVKTFHAPIYTKDPDTGTITTAHPERMPVDWVINDLKQDVLSGAEGGGMLQWLREYMCEEVWAGLDFTADKIQYRPEWALEEYDYLIARADPAYSNKGGGDYHTWILGGMRGKSATSFEVDVLDVFMTNAENAQTKHALWYIALQKEVPGFEFGAPMPREQFQRTTKLWENVGEQRKILDEVYAPLCEQYNADLDIQMDPRNIQMTKKEERIVLTLTPMFENLGKPQPRIYFSDKLRNNESCDRLVKQLLEFDRNKTRQRDDGPDALEGLIYYAKKLAGYDSYTPASTRAPRKRGRQSRGRKSRRAL